MAAGRRFRQRDAKPLVRRVGMRHRPRAPGRLPADGRLIQLDEPWAVPPGAWHTISLLDVLEHHGEPDTRFLASMPSRQLLVKVPLATGPLANAARLAAKFGRPRLLEGSFLVDDVSPHEVLFSARGLVAYGSPQRMASCPRSQAARRRTASFPTDFAWGALSVHVDAARRRGRRRGDRALAPAWSDTEVFLFERSAPNR